ncbi:putative oxidoreductase [Cladobotryum mycophilum]|uniref:Oxidoreductase n=1 Tax=Cladobotryum mycophilum TaxID=491253 RepID=A0ABR0SMZ3_9HYPO
MVLDYDPDKDIPDLAGRVILLTGGTSGIGKAAVLELAKHNPERIYFTGRNQRAADQLIAACPNNGANLTFLPCELDSLESIRQAAQGFDSPRLDIFIANAGVLGVPPSLTRDGYEIHFGVNHLGNSALLLHLLPVMLRTARECPGADVRFVAVASNGALGHPRCGIDFDGLRTTQDDYFMLGGWIRYGQSKLAVVLMAREMAKRYPQITSLAIHPGVVQTELTNSMSFWNRALTYVTHPRGLLAPRDGCCNTLWAATGRDVKEELEKEEGKGKTAYFEPVGKPNCGDDKCHDDELSTRLWEWTINEVGVGL